MKNSIVIFLILLSGISFGQKNTPAKTHNELETYKKVYSMALKNGDAAVALNSLYFIIAREGDKTPYKDSLAFLYFDMTSYLQCEIVAAEIVKGDNDSIEQGKRLTMLEVLALSQASLGKTKEAITSFERLLSKTNEMYHAYRLAELQFAYKRMGEALQSVQKAEGLKSSMGAPVKLEVEKGKFQNVKLEAAVQNLKGYILLSEYPNEKEKAIEAFKKALEIQPDFVLAKNNLALAESKTN